MAKVNFYLSSKADFEGRRLILLFFSFKGNRVQASIGETVPEKHWNKATHKVKSSATGAKELNEKMQALAFDVMKMFREEFRSKPATVSSVKSRILEIINPELGNSDQTQTLFTFVENFIQDVQGSRRRNSIKQYQVTFGYLLSFQKEVYGRRILDFESIDLDFYNDFIEYLTFHKGLARNTIGSHIKNLKMFMNEATERGINTNIKYKSRRFKVLKEDSDSIYLSESELQVIYDLDLNNCSRLDRVRDMFMIACWTGLRFSDLYQVISSNIKGEFLEIRTTKTDEFVVIPLHPVVKAILQKYNSELPTMISNQKMNAYLKEIGKLAEINEDVIKKISRHGTQLITTYKKYELISSHTARRSFATNMFEMGVPSLVIMAITGHKTEKAFLTYIKATNKQKAERLRQLWTDRYSILKIV